ncbi:MAG: hypothetical protein V7754_01075 [Halioglobus sp.]
MTSNTGTFNPQEFCSRKLWDIVNTGDTESENRAQLEAAIAELEERRSYLAELQLMGKSGDQI